MNLVALLSQPPSAATFRELLELELTSSLGGWNLTRQNGLEQLKKRSQLCWQVRDSVLTLAAAKGLTAQADCLVLLWWLWLPLALELEAAYQQQQRPLLQGILGAQGTGKTTLTGMVSLILSYLGYRTVSISLDDFYKTYRERQQLQQQDPRLIWRGPPGTHDLDLGWQVLSQLKQGSPQVAIPRFDKSLNQGGGDRVTPELLEGADIVLFEGWFVGVRPLEYFPSDHLPPPLVTAEDYQFARDNNQRLAAYVPLWDLLDRLMVVVPLDYRFSKQWRLAAEQKMKAVGKSGMSDVEVEQFVDYFWQALHPQLFIEPLIDNPELVDLVVKIDALHQPCQIYRPPKK